MFVLLWKRRSHLGLPRLVAFFIFCIFLIFILKKYTKTFDLGYEIVYSIVKNKKSFCIKSYYMV